MCVRPAVGGANRRERASVCLPEGKEQITLRRWEGFELGVPSQRRAIMYKRIVLAVDLADQAPTPKGLEQALELTKASGGELRLVNVQPVIPATFMEYVPADFDEEQSKRAKEALDAVVAAVDLPAERKSAVARAGGIYHELLQEASEWGADLIVVGSHRPVMSDYLLGSNAKTIVRHAQCSVLVVRE
jgi:nucleotide-binding universal stress UspA family protein